MTKLAAGPNFIRLAKRGHGTFGPLFYVLGRGEWLDEAHPGLRWYIKNVDGELQGEERAGMTIGEPANQNPANQSANQNKDENPLAGQKLTEVRDRGEAAEEARLIRRLQIMMSMVSSVISQDPGLTVEEASELAAGAKRAALAMFPDKELAYDLLYKPRLQRLMRERFRLQ
jgi:hypothetical protein